jgi:hypothetical protein
MINLELIPSKFIAFRTRWEDRNERMQTMVDAVNGDWDVDGPDDDEIVNRSPNMIQIALEDTAEASSIIPTVRVWPSGNEDSQKHSASAMERIAMSYLDVSQIELLTIRSMLDLGAYGLFSWLVYEDPETGSPTFQWRDPRTCFPEPGWKTMDSVRECFFARELYVNQLPERYREIVEAEWPNDGHWNRSWYHSKKIILLEYFTEDEWLICALYQSGVGQPGGVITYLPIELERGTNKDGICPVVVGQRMTLDNEPRGQFDQVVGLMQAHIRLMGMVLDYADQAVYSDVWVKDLIGPLNFGGGAYIQLGPNGNIGRVQPAVTDMSVFRELETLIDSMHLGGRWPKSRPGEIDQNIASAKFLEASAGMMNTVLRTNHFIMKRALEQALHVAFVMDKSSKKTRTVSGVLRNQQFMMERDTSDIDLKAKIRVDYGLGLGHDPAQAMVLGIQASQAGFVSREFVQENFEGITDVALERSRIDTERFRDMALARLLQGLEEKTIPESALIKIAKARMDGEDIFELYEKYVVEPAEEQMAQMPMSGLAGGPVAPGPMGGGGAPAPAAPAPEELLGALGIGGGGGPESAARLNVPMGGGSFMGTTTEMGGQAG